MHQQPSGCQEPGCLPPLGTLASKSNGTCFYPRGPRKCRSPVMEEEVVLCVAKARLCPAVVLTFPSNFGSTRCVVGNSSKDKLGVLMTECDR